MQDWVEVQKASNFHKVALVAFPLVIIIGYFDPVIFGVGLGLFFLVTSFRMLKKMLGYMLVLGIISAIFPPLAPIIFIVMLVFFFMRIRYVVNNWRPFVAGIVLYGLTGLLIARSAMYTYSYNSGFLESLIFATIGFFALKYTLLWLYKFGYNSESALGIMGSAPLIIISFILPFLKLHIGGDVFAPDAGFTDGHVTPGGEPVAVGTVNAHAGDPLVNSAEPINGAHLQHVKGHFRTAPDGDPTNNLSYKGPDAKPPNMSDMVYVDSYVRTVPDGDITNNLSYNGPSLDKPFVSGEAPGYVNSSLNIPDGVAKGHVTDQSDLVLSDSKVHGEVSSQQATLYTTRLEKLSSTGDQRIDINKKAN